MDLDDATLRDHWTQSNPAMLGALRRMEPGESWALDDSERIKGHLNELGSAIEKLETAQCTDAQRQALFQILGFLRSGRALHVLSYLDRKNPGFGERMIKEANLRLAQGKAADTAGDVAARVHIDRFVFLDRFALLARVFSKERVAQIQSTLEDVA